MEKFSRRTLLGGAMGAAGCGRQAKRGFAGYAFVANEDGQAVAAVDLTALTLVRHVRLDAAPGPLLSHAQRQRVYALTPSNGNVHDIAVRTLAREQWVATGGRGLDMRFDPKRPSLWVLTAEPNQLVEVSLERLEARRRIALPAAAVDFDVAAEQPRAVVNLGESMALVDLESNAVERFDPGAAISICRFRKDGRQLLAAHRDENRITSFDVASKRVVVRLPLAVRPRHFRFKADGGQLFVTGDGLDAVVIVFPYQTEVAETVLAGRAPGAMNVSAASTELPEYLFVTNPQSSQVTILNIESRRVVAVANVGTEPSHVAVTPDNQYALVLNRNSGDMAVLLVQSTARRTRFPPALLTMIPVGSKPVNAVVQAV